MRHIIKKYFLQSLICFEWVVLIFFNEACFAHAAHERTIHSPKVLLLNSYHYGYRQSDEITKTIFKRLLEEIPHADIRLEYMDAKRFDQSEDIQSFSKYLINKYRHDTLDIIIASDDHAFALIQQIQKQRWKEIPVVFCGLNRFFPEMLIGFPNYTGIIEKTDVEENVRLIETLHPEARSLYIITDATLTGIVVKQSEGKSIEQLTHLNVHYLDGSVLSLNDLLNQLENLPQDAVVIYQTFLRDKNKNNYTHEEIIPLISEHSSVPVYGFSEVYLGLGIVGGKLVSGMEQGVVSADLAIRILSGTAPDDIPVTLDSHCVFKFDYRQLKRFGISERLLPAGSQMIECPPPFFERHKSLIWTVLIIIILQSLFIIFLLLFRIWRRKNEQAIKNEHRLLMALMDNMPDHIYFKDTQSRFILNNRAHLSSFGLTHQEDTLGKTDFDFFPHEFAEEAFRDEQNIIKTGVPLINKMENITRNPLKPYWMSTTKVPISNEKDKVTALVGISRDITERIVVTEQIQSSLEEKEVLLKEIHHRVKNNLQVISSLLNLQSSYIEDPKTMSVFRESQDRVRSMALIHENLYKSTDISHLDLEDYIKTLVFSLKRSYHNHPIDVQFDLHVEDIPLGIDKAVPCGLIINELVSNALKHAFPDNNHRNNRISISFHKNSRETLCLDIRDNGQGLPDDFDWEKANSLGLKLVRILAIEQLGGKIQFFKDQGTHIEICFPV